MDELKEKILSVIEQRGKKKCTADTILASLHMTGSMDFVRVSKALDEMEKELLVFRTEDGGLESREQAGVTEGRITIAKNGMGYVDREDRESIKIEETAQMGAMDGDTVLVQCRLWQVYGTVIRIVKRAKTQIIGTYVSTARGLKYVPDDEKLADCDLLLIALYPQDCIDFVKTKKDIISSLSRIIVKVFSPSTLPYVTESITNPSLSSLSPTASTIFSFIDPPLD